MSVSTLWFPLLDISTSIQRCRTQKTIWIVNCSLKIICVQKYWQIRSMLKSITISIPYLQHSLLQLHHHHHHHHHHPKIDRHGTRSQQASDVVQLPSKITSSNATTEVGLNWTKPSPDSSRASLWVRPNFNILVNGGALGSDEKSSPCNMIPGREMLQSTYGMVGIFLRKFRKKTWSVWTGLAPWMLPNFWGTWYTAPLKGCKINEVIFCLDWSKKNCFGWPLVAVDIGVKLDVFTMQLFGLDIFEFDAVFSSEAFGVEKMGSKWIWNSPWRQGVPHPNQFILFGRFFCGLGQNMSITACPGGHAGIFCDLCDKETWATFRPRGDEGDRWS